MIKGTKHQEGITVINVRVPNHRASIFNIHETKIHRNKHTKYTIVTKDSNTLSIAIDTITRQAIS